MTDQRSKVLMVVEATAAGVGRHVTDLLSQIDLTRFDVTLAWSPIRSDQQFRDSVAQLAQRGVTTVEVPMCRRIDPRMDIRALRILTRLLWRESFDLVHAHSSKAGFLGRLAARIARPSAATVYSPNAISIPLNPKYWYPEKVAAWMTDAMVAVSESEQTELTGYKLVPEAKVFKITAGIPIPPDTGTDFEALRQELDIPADAIVVGTVGRISFQKDPETFLSVAANLVSRHPSVCFISIGDGDQLDEMREQTEKQGIAGRVRFLGYRPDARRLLAAFDIFVLTSRYESFGYVTCEAMALGKPVVASRVTGSRELVESGVTGMLVPAGDVAAFEQSITMLLGDPALRARYGAAGRDRVQRHFSLTRMVTETERLYQSLLNAKARNADQRGPARSLVAK